MFRRAYAGRPLGDDPSEALTAPGTERAAAYPGRRRVPYGQTEVVFLQEVEVVADFLQQILPLGVFLQRDQRKFGRTGCLSAAFFTGEGEEECHRAFLFPLLFFPKPRRSELARGTDALLVRKHKGNHP